MTKTRVKAKPFEIKSNGVSIYSTSNMMQACSVYAREVKKGLSVVMLHNGAVKYATSINA